MLNVDMNNEQQIRVRANPTTASGNPAPLDGALTGEILMGDVTILAGVDDMEIIIRSGPNAGPYQVRVIGDADLDEGVVTLQDIVQGNISTAMAANLGMTASDPEPKREG